MFTGADSMTPAIELLSRLGWSNLKKRNRQKALRMFKIINGVTPTYLAEMFLSNIRQSLYNPKTSRWNLALPAVKKRLLPEELCCTLGQKSGMHYQTN